MQRHPPRKRIPSPARTLLLACLPFLLSACANKLFYHPDSVIYRTPDQDGYTYDSITFNSLDGTSLQGWFIHAQGPAKGTVIHFHGNAQNLTAHYSYVSWLPENGYNLFAFDYRGYGQSKGKPSRLGIYQDSVAALNYITQRKDIQDKPLFVIAQSLGGANAITAIGKNDIKGIDGIVVDSAFYSHQSVAKSALQSSGLGTILSVTTPLLVSQGYDPGDWVDKIAPTPIAFVHGTLDKVVPYSHAEALHAKAKEPKLLWKIVGGSHTNALSTNREIFIPRILKFFDECLNGFDTDESEVQQPNPQTSQSPKR